MIRSTFAGFSTAQLGMRASQYALDVIGQNISNIGTEGYTKQKVDMMSLNLNSPGKFSSTNSTIIGFGVLSTGVSQMRDPYLDVQFRSQISKLGQEDARLSVLEDLSSTLDEVNKSSSIELQFQNLTSQLTKMLSSAGDPNQNGIIRSSAQTLTNMFREYANTLETTRANAEKKFTEDTMGDVNRLMGEIQELNATIKRSQINGHSALEVKDSLNLKLDELSQYMDINVQTTMSTQVTGRDVDYTRVTIKDADGNEHLLIDDVKDPAQFTAEVDANGKMVLSIKDSGQAAFAPISPPKGALKASLDMMNLEGTFDGSTTSGIAYYEKMLDSLASTFANTMNSLNIRTYDTTQTPAVAITEDLFSSSDGGPITAKNLSISDDWLKGNISLYSHPDIDANGNKIASDDSRNITAMVHAMSEKRNFSDTANKVVFNGSFQECYSSMSNVLNQDTKSTTESLKNFTKSVQTVAQARDSISGVSLDEEGIDILRFQKSYSAAARLMTALDEALNTLINGMGVVGR